MAGKPNSSTSLLLLIWLCPLLFLQADELHRKPEYRHPVRLALLEDWLVVANQRTGTLTRIDLRTKSVEGETKVCEWLTDLVALPTALKLPPGTPGLLALDGPRGHLYEIQHRQDQLESRLLLELPAAADRLAVAGDHLYLSSEKGRCLFEVVFPESRGLPATVRTLQLPYAPRELLVLNDDHLLVADAFQGRLGIVDRTNWQLRSERSVPGHNIRGLSQSVDRGEVYIAQQRIRTARSDYDELHWGRFLRNGVLSIGTATLLDPTAESLDGWFEEHGGIGNAAADPGVLLSKTGLLVVTLSGVGEVAVRHAGRVRRISVGAGPSALAEHQGLLYVANRFDDTISAIDLASGNCQQQITLGPNRPRDSIERGEQLFYDASLSHDGWVSCHSCHSDGHTSDLVIDTLGDGSYGNPKRVPSLLGVAGTGPWGWIGKTESLEEQVQRSVTTTMHGNPLEASQVQDLVAYLGSLQPVREKTEAHVRGRQLFEQRACATCHAAPTYTSPQSYDVGLVDELQLRRFNPPSLRGVGSRTRLMHDGRADSLETVILKMKHQLPEPLSDSDAAALLAFLKSL